MRRALIVVAITLALATAIAGGFYWHWYNSPRYALQQMAMSLQSKDMETFFNYLDLHEIINNIVSASSQDVAGPDDPRQNDWSRLTRQMGKKFARHFLPELFKSMEKQVKGLVEQFLKNLDRKQIIAVVAAVTVAKIDTRGEEAGVTLKDPKTGEVFRFQMRRYPDRVWRIVEVNYDDLKKFGKRELLK